MPCHLSKIQGLRCQGGGLKRGCLAHREIAGYRLLHRGHPLITIFTHPLNVSITSMLKTMNTRKIAFSTPFQPPHGDLGRKESSLELGFMARKIILGSITSNNSSDAVHENWEGSVQFTIQQLFSADARKKRRSLSNSLATSKCEPHDFIHLRASAVVGPESREADGCPSFLEKRDRRERSYFIEKSSQCTQIFPSRTSRACSLPKQKTQRLCVSSGVIMRTRIHTLLKRLASARHDNREKTVLLPECTLQTNQSVKTKKRMMCSPGTPYIVVALVVTS